MDHHTTDITARRRGPRRAALAGLAGASALALGTLTAAPAWAHDELISATPEAGEILTQVPDAVELEFSGDGLTNGEGVTNEIRLTGPEGQRWDGETTVDGNTLTTELDDGLPAGQFEVRYRVVYSDGHQEEETYTFAIEEGAAGSASAGDGDQASADGASEASDEESGDSGDAPSASSSSSPADESSAGAGEATEGQRTADAAAGDDSPAALDAEAEETALPAWLPVAFGAGALAVVIIAVLLVRRKISQVDQWKRDSDRDPGRDSGDRG